MQELGHSLEKSHISKLRDKESVGKAPRVFHKLEIDEKSGIIIPKAPNSVI